MDRGVGGPVGSALLPGLLLLVLLLALEGVPQGAIVRGPHTLLGQQTLQISSKLQSNPSNLSAAVSTYLSPQRSLVGDAWYFVWQILSTHVPSVRPLVQLPCTHDMTGHDMT